MNTEIATYYNQLAPDYDTDRFGNSYGQFLHAQERACLQQWLAPMEGSPVLDLGCGTGRFLAFATHGLDASAGMLEQARQKFPAHSILHGDAFAMPFDPQAFGAVFSMHMLMHLSPGDLQALLAETHRVLQPGGRFIFDFPSKYRRQFLGYKATNWHGANAYRLNEIKAAAQGHWQLSSVRGILFLPLHRFPRFIRPWLKGLDNLLCRSFLKRYASYLMVEMVKI